MLTQIYLFMLAFRDSTLQYSSFLQRAMKTSEWFMRLIDVSCERMPNSTAQKSPGINFRI